MKGETVKAMDRWDAVWLQVVTQLTILGSVSYAECDAEWDIICDQLEEV